MQCLVLHLDTAETMELGHGFPKVNMNWWSLEVVLNNNIILQNLKDLAKTDAVQDEPWMLSPL